jgi:hypothetical protein
MRINLDTLRAEIQEYLQTRGLVIFHSFPRTGEPIPAIFWDTEMHPDYREFVAAAEAAGAKVMTFFVREFSEDMIEEAWERLDDANPPGAHMDHEDRRAIEARLREASSYTGFTCQIELSFDSGQRVYILDLRTEWFEDLSELLERIDDARRDPQDDPGPTGPYFSKN